MALRAGRLNRVADLQELQQVRDPDNGDLTDQHVSVDAALRVGVEPLSSKDILGSNQVNSEITVKILLWYRDDVKSGWRFVVEGRNYDVVGPPIDRRLGRRYLECMCREVT